jgi:hypothetical protein
MVFDKSNDIDRVSIFQFLIGEVMDFLNSLEARWQWDTRRRAWGGTGDGVHCDRVRSFDGGNMMDGKSEVKVMAVQSGDGVSRISDGLIEADKIPRLTIWLHTSNEVVVSTSCISPRFNNVL